jgi:tRNA threonylcarbamoyladenosine biosynthesis protein TsaB
MPVLAFDTSGRRQSVAVVADGRLLAESSMETRSTHSETLLRRVDLALEESRVALRDLTVIAVTSGPGMFTGLRIGIATAKGLALPAGIRLVGRSTLAVLAAALAEAATPRPGTLVCALMEAGRGQIYRGLFRTHVVPGGDNSPLPCVVQSVCNPQEALLDLEEPSVIGGGGLSLLSESLSASLPLGTRVIEQFLPLARMLALTVEREERRGTLGELALVPNYVREADARPSGKA